MTAPTPDDVDRPVEVTDLVIQKIAAHAARTTPGVRTLRPGLTRHLGRLLPLTAGHDEELSAAGVSLRIHAGRATADITVDTVLEPNTPCLATANAIQERVRAAVGDATGIDAIVVTVNVVDIALDP